MKESPLFLDLFAGGGGLSEGFIKAGFTPVAHVEKDRAACYTLKTRMAYHWLCKQGRKEDYFEYLRGNITRQQLYDSVPEKEISSTINEEISEDTLQSIFASIDALLDGRQLDFIIGGPPCQAYSFVGRSRDENRMRGDKRNFLYIYYSEFLKRYKPRYFVFENVIGLLSAKPEQGEPYIDSMFSSFRNAGYKAEHRVLSSEN